FSQGRPAECATAAGGGSHNGLGARTPAPGRAVGRRRLGRREVGRHTSANRAEEEEEEEEEEEQPWAQLGPRSLAALAPGSRPGGLARQGLAHKTGLRMSCERREDTGLTREDTQCGRKRRRGPEGSKVGLWAWKYMQPQTATDTNSPY
ncbi:unnamed protein product, partial [Prorocentrum cordatum]